MIRRISFSSAADRDLEDIATYLGERNLRACDRLLDEMGASIESLKQFPFSGSAREELATGLRSKLCGMYLIFYIVEREELRILRVIHGVRKITRDFFR